MLFLLLIRHAKNQFQVFCDFHKRVDSLGRVHALKEVLVIDKVGLILIETLNCEIKVDLDGEEDHQ